jgi:hypothetical protein
MARKLRQNTATVITVGPFIDVTDAKTPEVALTATNEHLTLMVDNMSTGAGTPTLALDANATASGGSNDMVHITNDDAGYYSLELTQANTNYLGGALLSINYVTDHLPVFHEFEIVTAQVYDSLYGSGDLLDVNTSQAGGTAWASGAITAASIATDAIDADALATDAVTELKNAIADQVWDENITGHITAASAGAVLQPNHSGACQAGGNTTTVVLASSASSSNDAYNGCLIFGWVTADRTNFFSDYITDYVGASRSATVTGILPSPDATYTYVVMPGGTIPGASAPAAADNAAAVWNAAFGSYATEGNFRRIV